MGAVVVAAGFVEPVWRVGSVESVEKHCQPVSGLVLVGQLEAYWVLCFDE